MQTLLLLPILLWPALAAAPLQVGSNLLCLAANVYFEAGNQSWRGKLAVKDVTLNRGGEVCKTVFARKQFSWTHQQRWSKVESFLLDSPKLSKLEKRAWEEAKVAAQSSEVVLSKDYKYFHTLSVSPYWTGPGIVIGEHKFLKGVK